MKKINKLFINTAAITGGALLGYVLIKTAYKKMYNNFLKEFEEEKYIEDEIDDTDEMIDEEIDLELSDNRYEGRKYITLRKKA